MIRAQLEQLVALGTLSPSTSASSEQLYECERLLSALRPSLSDEEAVIAVRLFGPDDSSGLAWTLIHLIESAPGWPLLDELPSVDNQWIQLLRERAGRV